MRSTASGRRCRQQGIPHHDFGYRKITVERPLRQFPGKPGAHRAAEEERGFKALAESRKKASQERRKRPRGEAKQEAIRKLLTLPGRFKDRDQFVTAVETAAKKAGD